MARRERARAVPVTGRDAADISTPWEGKSLMTIDVVTIQPLVALIAGILILLIPRLLNIIVAIYLILIGIVGLWPNLRLPH
jgi:hypothetical protein